MFLPRRFLAFFVLVFFASLVFAGVPALASARVDPVVLNLVASNGSAPVVVVFKTGVKSAAARSFDAPASSSRAVHATLRNGRLFESVGMAAGLVDANALEALVVDPSVAGIYFDRPVFAHDLSSNIQINADDVQRYQLNGQNVTGVNQTICVIDTGIDYRDSAFGSCSSVGSGGACRVVGGYDFVNGDSDPLDDHGHGTHAAGIAAANSSIVGVAPGARLAAVKVLNSGGSGSLSNVVAGINWCTGNRTAYNISVISMSLGAGLFSNYCDSEPDALAVQSAFSAGLFVSVSTGNDYNTSYVSAPACSSNSTPVGAVSSSDVVADFSNNWANLLLLAPGVSINSTVKNNGSQVLSGTSMAAPHVSGAAALLQNFAQAANGTLASPLYVRSLLNRTGVAVVDGRVGAANSVHYRIDALAALQAFAADVAPRNITLASFSNGSATGFSYSFVNVSFFDDNATPSSCTLSWSNGTTINFSMLAALGSCSYNVSGQQDVNASLRVFVTDSFGNVGSEFFVRSFDSQAPQNVSLSLANNSVFSNASVLLSASFFDLNADSCVLELDGVNSSVRANASSCQFNASVTEGTHNFTVFVNDSFGRYNSSERRFFVVDRTRPASFSFVLPTLANGSLSVFDYVFVNVTFVEANPSACTLVFDSAVNYSMALSGFGSSYYCFANVSTLAEGVHNYSVFVNDSAGSFNSSSLQTVVLDRTAPSEPSFVAPSFANASFSRFDYVLLNASFVEANPSACMLTLDGFTNRSMALSGSASQRSCFVNVTGLSEGPHNFTIFVNDSTGRSNFSSLRTVVLDFTPPSGISVVAPAVSNGSFSRLDYVLVNASFAESNPSACTLVFDSAVNYSMALSGFGSSYYCFANVSTLAEGVHNYSVFVNDSAGSSAFSVLRTVVLDRSPPIVSAVSVFPSFVNSSGSFSVSVIASDLFSSVLNVSVSVTNASGVQAWSQSAVRFLTNYTLLFTSLSGLSDGNYTFNVTAVDNASFASFDASLNVTLDSAAPSAPVLSANSNDSGFIFLNWSGGADAVAFDHYDLWRNGSRIFTGSALNFSDSSVVFASSYTYSVFAFDRAGNSNASVFVSLSANDSVAPRQTVNVLASNLANGAVNLSWANVTIDVSGAPERGVFFRVFRTNNASLTNLSLMTELANTTTLYFLDASVLAAGSEYRYVVASFDANGNFNNTFGTSNSVNQTTVSACTNAFSDFSACFGGSQSRTRTCLGVTETQTQSCTISAASSGSGSSDGGSGGSASFAGGASAPSSGGARGGGGGGGSGKTLFIVQDIPAKLALEPGQRTTTEAQVSSYYTGFLRVRNVTISGVPRDWYTLSELSVVSPISKTPFSIQWHPPEDARGNYPVRIDIVGVGTKNAGLLNASYEFRLILSPPSLVQSSSSDRTESLPLKKFPLLPTVRPASLEPAGSGGIDFSLYFYVFGFLVAVCVLASVVELRKWKRMSLDSFGKKKLFATKNNGQRRGDA